MKNAEMYAIIKKTPGGKCGYFIELYAASENPAEAFETLQNTYFSFGFVPEFTGSLSAEGIESFVFTVKPDTGDFSTREGYDDETLISAISSRLK